VSLFLEVDLSQGESRIVRVLTKDPRMIALARSKPWEYDDHKTTASIVYKKLPDQITRDERQIGKKVGHASNYGQRGKTFSDALLKETEGKVVIPPDECQRMIDIYLGANQPILDWQARTRDEVVAKGWIEDSWGHRLTFKYEPASDDLYRRAYAARPQGDLAKLLLQFGLKPLYAAIRRERWRAAINATVHDSLLVSCADAETGWAVYDLLCRTLQQERDYYGIALAIPIEAKIGRTWGTLTTEFKRPASRDQFVEAWRACEQG
jgi:DNA polymerase I-like protein with 3'-5' exonuclease and polymerase domains